MNKQIKYVVVGDKGLTIAIRGDKKAYAKPYGGDSFDPDLGVEIATKKLRLKELASGISQANRNIRAIEQAMDNWNDQLAKEYKKVWKMEEYSDAIADELNGILSSLNQD